MTDRDDIRTETDAASGTALTPAERKTVESQPPRADAAEAQPDGPQHEYSVDATGGEPIEPTLEDVRSPERDSGELDESARGARRALRDASREPELDDFVTRADPPTGDDPL